MSNRTSRARSASSRPSGSGSNGLVEVGATIASPLPPQPAEDEGDDEPDENDEDQHEEDDHDMIVPCLPLHRPDATSLLRGRTFAPGRDGLLAIINRTPDSFYDQGMFLDDDVALDAVERAVAAGADAVDIGGVKAGPGPEVSAAEELARVVPFVEAIRAAHPQLIISVDTWRADVADAACAVGRRPGQRRLGRRTTRR